MQWRPACKRRQATQCRLLVAMVLLLASGVAVQGVKLKVHREECMTYELSQYEPFYGSFVSLPDAYYVSAAYVLVITAPSGIKVHASAPLTDGSFHMVAHEAGRYRFCLTQMDSHYSRYVTERDIMWDLHVGHTDYTSEHAKEHDAHSLWHYVHMVDAQMQQLRGTVNYLHWREKRHRMTVTSTKSRVLWYGMARSLTLVGVSILQVLGVRYLFRDK